MNKSCDELELRMKEIMYDIQRMSDKKEDVTSDQVVGKLAELPLELFDCFVRIFLEDEEYTEFRGRLITTLLSRPVVVGLTDRVKNPDKYYAPKSDDVIETV